MTVYFVFLDINAPPEAHWFMFFQCLLQGEHITVSAALFDAVFQERGVFRRFGFLLPAGPGDTLGSADASASVAEDGAASSDAEAEIVMPCQRSAR